MTVAVRTLRVLRACGFAGALAASLHFAGCATTPSPSAGPAQSAVSTQPALTPGAPVQAPVPAAVSASAALQADASPTATPPAPAEDSTPAAAISAEPPKLDRAIVDAYVPPPALERTRLDPADDARRSDLWERLRKGFVLPDLRGDLVTKWEQWYGSRPDYVKRMTERGGRYLFFIVEEIERRGLPSDLALLPFIESAFNPQAESRARASGMWQFMPATGRDFELKQNLFRDDRRDVLESTRAALDYLQRLATLFGGDWHLALAAYNWGQGNVLRAMERNRRAGKPAGYEDLRMPDETRNYVPKLQAVKNLVARPEAFGMVLQQLDDHPYFLSVLIERDIDVVLAARLAEIPLDDFRQLNPQMNKPVMLAAGTPRVLLPYDNANTFLRNLAAHHGQLASWTAWVAPRTIRPEEAAKLVGMPDAELREVNRIPARMLVKAGSTLLVPRSAHASADVSEKLADNAAIALAPEPKALRRVSFKAGTHGDTVVAVARRYGVGAHQVAQWNGVSPQAHFKPGQPIVVMVAHSTGKASAAVGSKRARQPASGQRKPTRNHLAPKR